jgi:hypothetical protein
MSQSTGATLLRPPARVSLKRGMGAVLIAAVLAIGAGAGWSAYRRAQGPNLPSGVPGRDRPARVVLYGDSLAEDASAFFRNALTAHGRAQVQTRTLPGTAICDWFKDMSKTTDNFRPDAVVVEFSGNNLTPCLRDSTTGAEPTGAALVERYRADADKATQIVSRHGATVYWVGGPADRSPALSAQATSIRALYQSLPARFVTARFVDAGTAVLEGGVSYTDYLPCLPNEPCTGPTIGGKRMNQVRAPDGVHFCPVVVTARRACPVWSSGAFRFGTAMAAPAIADLGL